MNRFLSSAFTALTLIAWTPAFAGSHCTCDAKCAQECKKDKTENCACKSCDCAKGKGCKHHKCGKPDKGKPEKKETKKSESTENEPKATQEKSE